MPETEEEKKAREAAEAAKKLADEEIKKKADEEAKKAAGARATLFGANGGDVSGKVLTDLQEYWKEVGWKPKSERETAPTKAPETETEDHFCLGTFCLEPGCKKAS